jgi:hypothetical protein
MSMVRPPAACIAAVDPVGVQIQIPEDQTLKEKSWREEIKCDK